MDEQFQVGERVLVQGSIIATLTYVNYDDNRVAWAYTSGGVQHRGEGALSHTQIDRLSPILQAELDAQPDVANDVPTLSSKHNGAKVSNKPKNDPDAEGE